MSLLKKIARGWMKFAWLMERITAPFRKVLGFLVMSFIYLFVIPWWSLFMAPKDPLHTKLDPDAETYFERHEPTEDTLERLSHIS